jgi:hypothetical protein
MLFSNQRQNHFMLKFFIAGKILVIVNQKQGFLMFSFQFLLQ